MEESYVTTTINRMLTILVAFIVLAAGLLWATSRPAHASLVCNWSSISWQTGGSTWGAGKFCGGSISFAVQTDDRLTDGYCVHAEAYESPYWHYVPNTQSCGSPVTSSVDGGAVSEVRLIRGDPRHCITADPGTACNGIGVNYFTLYKVRF
jgi:hypothetical protein